MSRVRQLVRWLLALPVGCAVLFVLALERRRRRLVRAVADAAQDAEERGAADAAHRQSLHSRAGENRFASVPNFRDASGLVGTPVTLQPGRVFRSASPNVGSPEEHDAFHALQVRTLLDLRMDIEQRDLAKPSCWTQAFRSQHAGARGDGRVRFLLDLFPMKSVMGTAPLLQQLRVLWLVVAKKPGLADAAERLKAESMAVMLAFTQRAGLRGLYVQIAEEKQAELCQALEVLADPAQHPVLVHCSAGKDRTGVVCALAQLALGVPEGPVVVQFTESAALLPEAFKLQTLARHPGIPEDFAACTPPGAMQFLLRHLEREYGGVLPYLDHIGFGAAARERLRAALL